MMWGREGLVGDDLQPWRVHARVLDPATMDTIELVWDMETGDPDDFLTLLWLADHPRVNLRAVTVTPGSRAQIGVVRWGLRALGRGDVPVGAYNLDHPKDSVSAWHYASFGDIPPSDEARPLVHQI